MLNITTIEQALGYIANNRTNVVQSHVHDTKDMFYNSYQSRIGEVFLFDEVKAKLKDIAYYDKTIPNYGALTWELQYELRLEEFKIDTQV